MPAQNILKTGSILLIAALLANVPLNRARADDRPSLDTDTNVEESPTSPVPPELTGEDKTRAEELGKQIQELRKQGKYAEAIPLAKEILTTRLRVQGAQHWETADARRRLQTLEKIGALNSRSQAEMASNRRVRPKALFDDAHFNPSGFQPLADLFSAIGFEVGKNRRRLQPNTLSAYNILVIAGAVPTDIRNSVTISPDGRTIASGGAKQTIKFWNLETGQELKILRNGAWVGQLRFAPDGRTLAASGADGTISLWDVVTGRVVQPFAGTFKDT